MFSLFCRVLISCLFVCLFLTSRVRMIIFRHWSLLLLGITVGKTLSISEPREAFHCHPDASEASSSRVRKTTLPLCFLVNSVLSATCSSSSRDTLQRAAARVCVCVLQREKSWCAWWRSHHGTEGLLVGFWDPVMVKWRSSLLCKVLSYLKPMRSSVSLAQLWMCRCAFPLQNEGRWKESRIEMISMCVRHSCV